MNEVTEGLDFTFVNIDDILVFSNDQEEHKSHLRALFQRLREYGLLINLQKCILGKEEVQYLGHLVTQNRIKPLADRVTAIQNYK